MPPGRAPDNADAMFNLALLLQRQTNTPRPQDYWRRYLASDCQSQMGDTGAPIFEILRDAIVDAWPPISGNSTTAIIHLKKRLRLLLRIDKCLVREPASGRHSQPYGHSIFGHSVSGSLTSEKLLMCVPAGERAIATAPVTPNAIPIKLAVNLFANIAASYGWGHKVRLQADQFEAGIRGSLNAVVIHSIRRSKTVLKLQILPYSAIRQYPAGSGY